MQTITKWEKVIQSSNFENGFFLGMSSACSRENRYAIADELPGSRWKLIE
jgi:hypothetical protein